MKSKIIFRYVVGAIVAVLIIRLVLGIYASNQIAEDTGTEGSAYPTIVCDYQVIIAGKVRTYSYGQETTGVFEKNASVYYYDGEITIQNQRALRTFLIRDVGGVTKKTMLFPEEVLYTVYETVPRFYDDPDDPDQTTKMEIETPLVIYELNAFNMIVDKYYVDKEVDYVRIPIYERK